MGNGSSRSSLADLQMSCPDFITDDNKTARHVNNVQEFNAQRKSNDFIEGGNKETGNYSPSTYRTPLSSGFGSDGFSGRGYVHDLSPGNQASGDIIQVPQSYDHQSLKCQESNKHLGRKCPLGLSDKQFGVYNHVTEHSKHHQYFNFDDSLQQSYPALTQFQFEQQMDNSRKQTDVEQMESFKMNDQNGSDEIVSSVDPLQSYGFVGCTRDSVQFMNNLPSSGGFDLSSNYQMNSSSTQSSSNDFAPKDIDMGRYNDFFAGAVAKPPVSSFDCDSPLQSKVNLNEESGSSSQSDRSLKLEVSPGPPCVEKPVSQLSSRMSGCEPVSPTTSEIVYPSLIGYCSFGGDPSSCFRRNEGELRSDTGEFQPCSVDPDLSFKQSQRGRSQHSTQDFHRHQSEPNNCDLLSVNNEEGSRIFRTCSGYSSCSNCEEGDDILSVATDSNIRCPSLDHDYGKSYDSGRHNSCVSVDSQYDLIFSEGSQQHNSINIIDGKKDLENNVPNTDKDDDLMITGKCRVDGFRKIKDEELTLFQVDTKPDALSIYDGIANRPVKFSALMCVAPEDIEMFAMSFLCKLRSWGFQIFLPIRDLNLTGPYHENLTRVIKERCNEKLIVIVSKSYSKSDECLFLTYFAKTLDPAAHQRNIIPILIDKDIPNIPNVLTGLSYIHYNQAVRNQFLRKRLESALLSK